MKFSALVPSTIICLSSLLAPLAASRQLHGLVAERDWSKTVHQLNLHHHLTTPTTRDIFDGVENSRRLARNAIRLGIENDTHRKLIADNPPTGIIKEFDEMADLPSLGPRVSVDGTTDPLPFGDGPGVFPQFPTGTNDFWRGTGDGKPTKMWEVVACPVADVDAFLSNPLRCVFGGDDGSLLDFFSTVGTEALDAVMDEAIIPLGTEVIWTVSGLAWLERVFSFVCDILGIVDSIVDIVESLGGFGGDFLDAINPTNWFRGRSLLEEYGTCTGHFSTCNGDNVDCEDCFTTADAECAECRTCFQPLETSVPDMDGLCISTTNLRDFVTADVPSLIRLQSLYSALMANYMSKKASKEVVDVLIDALGVDVDSGVTVIDKIDEQCPADSRRHLRDSLSSNKEKQKKIGEFLQSEEAKSAKKFASQNGLKDDDVDEIFSNILNDLSGKAADSFNDNIKDKIKETLLQPEKMELIEKLLIADVEANRDNYAGRLAAKIFQDSTDQGSRRLDTNELAKTMAKLQDIKEFRQAQKRELGLEESCDNILDSIKAFLKDEVIKPLLEGLLSSLETSIGPGFTFTAVQSNPVYTHALNDVADVAESSLLLPFGFVNVMDPWSKDGAFQSVMGTVVDIFQLIVGYLLFGCNVFQDEECGPLPSVRDSVLPINENRDGDIFMVSGCDSEFEGELLWYTPALDILQTLLDKAADSILEFFNVPINVISFLLKAVSKLFSHMNDVCSYLDSYVQLALVEATHENSRYALHELACREPETIIYQRGYGCDGLDNDCDPDKAIDECEEDIFPPDIDNTNVPLVCGSKIFAGSDPVTEATDCILSAITAVDDCKDVVITPETMMANKCYAIIRVQAIAQGCGERVPEDTTILDTSVKIDNEPPEVHCSLETQELNVKGEGVFKDLKFNYTAVDGDNKCTKTQDLVVSIEIFSTEVVATGEEMVIISTPLHSGDIPSIFAEANTCLNEGSDKCKIESSSSKSSKDGSREYLVRVTATDEAGNVGVAECNTVVGDKHKDKDPRFLIGKLEMFGGVE